jgi:predicted transcriptional regulator
VRKQRCRSLGSRFLSKLADEVNYDGSTTVVVKTIGLSYAGAVVRLGELERAVMQCLWAGDRPMTVREVHETLSATRSIAYTTVLTTLQRMARKGLLHQRRDERAHRYSAVASREHLFAELLADALGVAEGEPSAFVRFVDELGPDERAALRRALDGGSETRHQ